MANVIITLKIMPTSPEEDLGEVENKAKELIEADSGHVHKVDIQPVAFGLKSVNIIFVKDESKGSTEELEDKIAELEQVSGVEVTDVRRAVG